MGYLKPELQVEIEHGITNRLEFGFYATVVPEPGESLVATPATVQSNGLKQRLRYRFAEAGEWPIDVGLYFELVENTREVELEAKVLLQRRVGIFRFVATWLASSSSTSTVVGTGSWHPPPGLPLSLRPGCTWERSTGCASNFRATGPRAGSTWGLISTWGRW